MNQRPFQAIALAVVIVAVAACGSTGGSGGPASSPGASAASVTFVESMAAFCSSFRSMLLGIGNPDAGTPSDLSKKLDDAVHAGDTATADSAAADIKAELERGRAQAEIAAGYAPVAPAMLAMAKLLVAYEAEIEAHRTDADHTKSPTPGAAFTAAGGNEAYNAMFEGITKMTAQPGPTPAPCPALSGTP